MINQIDPVSQQFNKHHMFSRIMVVSTLGGALILLYTFGWPMYQRLRTGKEVEPQSITTTVREVITQPRTAVLGTSFSIRTIATKGPQGDKGETGPRGERGEPGERGEDGRVGAQGEAGPAGAIGAIGATGATGAKGDTGAAGPAGAAGADGEDGEDGTDGAGDPNSVLHTGNTFGQTMVIGTNDAFNLAFETNSTQRAFFDTLGNFTINDGDLSVNGGAGFGNVAAVDTGTSLVSALATGAYARTGGSYTVNRATAEYTPSGNGGSEFLNVFRAESTIGAGDGTTLNAQRGIGSFLTNNSSGLVTNIESFRGTVVNNGTTESRSGSFVNTFTNNGTMNGVDTRTAMFDFINSVGGSVAEHYGLMSGVTNSGAFTSTMTGLTSLVTNAATGTVGGEQIGSRLILSNSGVADQMLGSSINVKNEDGGVTNDIIGQHIRAGNYNGASADNLYWIRAGLDVSEAEDDVTLDHYGLYLDTVASGATSNYGVYISGAEGGSGTNAALWVNSGLSRFAAATTDYASINIASSGGDDVAAPNTGDLWWNGTNLNFYDGTTTTDLLAGGGGGGDAFVNGGNAFGGDPGQFAVLGTTDVLGLSIINNNVEQLALTDDNFFLVHQVEGISMNSTGGIELDMASLLDIGANQVEMTVAEGMMLTAANDGEIMQIIANHPTPQAVLALRVGDSTNVGGNYRLASFTDTNGIVVGSIDYSELTTTYNTTSDARLKENIVDTSLTLEDLMKIQIHDYTWKGNENSKTSYGVLAQELNEIFPNAVRMPRGEKEYWSVDYSKLVPLTIKAIQDQQHGIAEVKDQVKLLADLGQISQVAKWSFNSWEFVVDVTFTRPVTFMSNVAFKGRVVFADKDMGGSVVIPAGQQTATVTFASAFNKTPVITVSPVGQTVSVAVDQATTQGFTVKVSAPVAEPLTVNWTALAIDTAQVTQPSTTPSASPTISPSPSPAPTVAPTPAASVVPSTSISPTPASSVSPTPSASPQPSQTPVELLPSPTLSPSPSPAP